MKHRLYVVPLAALVATGFSVAPAHAAAGDPVTNLVVDQAQVGTQDKVTATFTPNDTDTAYRVYITSNSDGSVDVGPTTDNTTVVSGGTDRTASLLAGGLASGGTYYVVARPLQPSDAPKTITSFTALTLDTTAPTGSFSLNRTSGYLMIDFGETITESASFAISQTSLSDDSGGPVTRSVIPGDGSAAKSWTSSGAFTLVYTRAGTFTPKVHVTDEFGNAQDIALGPITVKADRVAPVVHITRPASTKVAAWRRIHGTATDVGSGINEAAAFVVQKRGGTWYSYDFGRRKWLKGYSTLTKTIRRSKAQPAEMHVSAAHTWQTPLIRGLRTGKLHVEAVALDKDFNIAKAPNVNVTLH